MSVPFNITCSITGVWWLYGMNVRDGTDFVMIELDQREE